jgi:hypothetical protein
MSERNGDRAPREKTHKPKLHHQQRIRAFNGLPTRTVAADAGRSGVRATLRDPATAEASLAMQDEGGPTRAGE